MKTKVCIVNMKVGVAVACLVAVGVCGCTTSKPETESTQPPVAKEAPPAEEVKAYASDEERDLDVICTEITNVVESKDVYADMPEENRQRVMARRVEERLSTTMVRDAFGYLTVKMPSERYAVLQTTAEQAGLDGWSCPPIESLWK